MAQQSSTPPPQPAGDPRPQASTPPPGAPPSDEVVYDFTDFRDYYAILQVEPDADREEIKKSHRRLILEWHPDKRPDSPTRSGTKMFQLINDAWDVLKEDDKRAEYTKMWRIWQKEKLQPMERAELARKEGRSVVLIMLERAELAMKAFFR